MEFLSISIDMVNSTLSKTKINSICIDESVKNDQNKKIINFLINFEKQLYSKLFYKSLLDKFFLVKSIGDELWYLVDLEDFIDDDKKKIVVRQIVSILQEIADNILRLDIPNRNLTLKDKFNDGIYDEAIKDSIFLTTKITIDLINDAYNFNDFRQDMLHEFYRQEVWNKYNNKDSSPRKSSNKEYLETISQISHNLNLGSINVVDDENIRCESLRYDLIGRDVDRFFRITKKSIAGLVMSGKNLFDKYLIELSSIERSIPGNDLKGIGEDYSIYYLPYRNAFGIIQKYYYKSQPFEDAIRLLIQEEYITEQNGVLIIS